MFSRDFDNSNFRFLKVNFLTAAAVATKAHGAVFFRWQIKNLLSLSLFDQAWPLRGGRYAAAAPRSKSHQMHADFFAHYHAKPVLPEKSSRPSGKSRRVFGCSN